MPQALTITPEQAAPRLSEWVVVARLAALAGDAHGQRYAHHFINALLDGMDL